MTESEICLVVLCGCLSVVASILGGLAFAQRRWSRNDRQYIESLEREIDRLNLKINGVETFTFKGPIQ